MPIYVLRCAPCGRTIEKLYPSYAASQNACCDVCGTALDRVPAVGGFVLSGGGWFADGYDSSKKTRS